jgi:hypothetical protein
VVGLVDVFVSVVGGLKVVGGHVLVVVCNAIYVMSGKVSARVRKRSSRRHRQKMSEYVSKTSKKYKNNHFFQFF